MQKKNKQVILIWKKREMKKSDSGQTARDIIVKGNE